MDWKHGEAANTCGWSNWYRSLHSCYWSVSIQWTTYLNDLFLIHLLIQDKIDLKVVCRSEVLLMGYVFYITGFSFFSFCLLNVLKSDFCLKIECQVQLSYYNFLPEGKYIQFLFKITQLENTIFIFNLYSTSVIS